MAKMIKCPTCGTGIEVPPHSAGQVVKCPGCGKSLKLLARKPRAGAPAGAGPGGSVAGGSVSGSSVSALTVSGDAPQDRRPSSYSPDELPSLDSFCAVCGRSAEPDDLVEDNGKLVCMDCIKGARSKIDRPEGGAELIAFKPAAYVPNKRSRLVHFTPSLLALVVIALVYVGCSVYLNLFPKPVGTASASLSSKKHGPIIPVITPPTNTVEHQPATQPVETSTDTQATQPVAVAPPQPEPAQPATQPLAAEPQATQPTAIADANATPPDHRGSILFGNEAAQAQPAQPAQPAPVRMDPLEQGMQALIDKKYDEARRDLQAAKAKYIGAHNPNGAWSGQQMETLEALGAAEIGAKDFDAAKATLNRSYQFTPAESRTAGLVVNRLVAMLSTSTPPRELGFAINDVEHYLQSHPDDEYAATVFGTSLAKAATIQGNLDKTLLASMWQFLDQYNDRLAQEPENKEAHPNKLKWGTEWLPAEDVKTYRAARMQGDSISLTQAARDLENARAKDKLAQSSLANAKQMQAMGRPVDINGYQKNADAADANFAAAQKAFDIATAAMHPAQWLTADQLTPVIPETRAPDLATNH